MRIQQTPHGYEFSLSKTETKAAFNSKGLKTRIVRELMKRDGLDKDYALILNKSTREYGVYSLAEARQRLLSVKAALAQEEKLGLPLRVISRQALSAFVSWPNALLNVLEKQGVLQKHRIDGQTAYHIDEITALAHIEFDIDKNDLTALMSGKIKTAEGRVRSSGN